jgi:hypothetical protein
MTTTDDVAELVDRYHNWLRNKSTLKAMNASWTEITTPFIDRHNDYIQIYASKQGDQIVLHDDGYTLSDLEISGCKIETPHSKQLLQTALNGFGIELDRGALRVKARADNFPQRKHALLQAILAVNDLFYVASSTVRSLFREDVAAWLDLNEVRYLPHVQFIGKTGYPHNFDFAVPKSKSAPERLLKAVANPSKDAAQSLIFAWLDTRQVRDEESTAVAILNDRDKEVPSAVIDALGGYDIQSILWSTRDQHVTRLVA